MGSGMRFRAAFLCLVAAQLALPWIVLGLHLQPDKPLSAERVDFSKEAFLKQCVWS